MYKMIGALLPAVGVVLLAMGVSASEALGSDVSKFFYGSPTEGTLWLALGGGACILLGLRSLEASRGRENRA